MEHDDLLDDNSTEGGSSTYSAKEYAKDEDFDDSFCSQSYAGQSYASQSYASASQSQASRSYTSASQSHASQRSYTSARESVASTHEASAPPETSAYSSRANQYSARLNESTVRLSKYTAENDRLLDEVSTLRLQIREMKNDRRELVRAHHESMSLLAAVSEEKLIEFQSKSEAEASDSKAAQEEALRTVLEMMERDCEERVQELDARLAEAEEERERAAMLQSEAARLAQEERENRSGVEEACRLAVEKLVKERESRSVEIEERSVREMELQRELEDMKELLNEAARVPDGMGHRDRMDQDRRNEYEDEASYDESYDSRRSGGSSYSGQQSDPGYPPPRQQGGPQPPGEYISKRPPIFNNSNKHPSIFLDDDPSTMTRGRRLALGLMNAGWYRPQHKKNWDASGLALQSAWCHFEHSVLPRYLCKKVNGSMPDPIKRSNIMEGEDDDDEDARVSVYEQSANGSTVQDEPTHDSSFADDGSDVADWLDKPKEKKKGDKQKEKPISSSRNDWRKTKQIDPKAYMKQNKMGRELVRASPGESTYPTHLYSAFFTPLSQMGSFGIGVGLYFSSLRGVAFITLVAGLINLPNILYFAGEEYSKNQLGVGWALRGSAVCTEMVWVACPGCEMEDFRWSPERIAGTTTVTPDGELQTLVFALKNTCDGATMSVGIFNLASLGWIFLSLIALTIYQKRKQRQFDEREQTAQDYSIAVWNPPDDATEPEEWKDFFESRFGGHVTCCTVTIDNDLLVKTLAQRREVIAMLEEKVREGSMVNAMKLSELAAKVENGRRFFGNLKSRIDPGIPELVGRLTVLNAKIQGLAQQEYVATRVFCTFETESAQRQVLSEMTVGGMAAYRNNTHVINPNLLFRGEHVLLIREAEEPNTIRWTDLDEKLGTRIKQISITSFVGFLCIAACAVIVFLCNQFNGHSSALAISAANALFPFVAKMLTNFETHPSETDKHVSLYIKIGVFRWVITAIVITLITPFTSTLGSGPDDLLEAIFAIFFYDLILSNALQLLDPVSNFKRHCLAPRAASQERMNILMGGTEYTIAERYTNMTKTLFLTFYYCAIYPSAFLVCAVTIFINYYVDTFSLLRSWTPAPLLGPYIANFSRAYFISTAFAAMAITSSYFFSGFPFDNLCAEDVSHSAYYGTWKITNGAGETTTAEILPGERSFKFCNQFLGPGSNFAFPVGPDKQPPDATWMTAEQEQLTGIYGIVSLAVLSMVGAVFLHSFLKGVKDMFSVSYKPVGNDQGVPFSENENISSYIPQALSEQFTHPLLAVNIDDIGTNLFDWSDPDRSHSFYDLTRDAEQLLGGNEDLCYKAFSRVRHWPPNAVEPEERERKTTKSALKRHKDMGHKRNVSWSSKVTCKTYSKDDANHWDSFDANASSTKMNFDSHEPIYDPGAQDEARTFKESSSDGTNSTEGLGFDDSNQSCQSDSYYEQHDARGPTNRQPTPAQQFDPYYNTGLDYANQLPDQMYGDSQTSSMNDGNQYNDSETYENSQQFNESSQSSNNYDHGASWEGSEEQSCDQSSRTGSSAYSQTDGESYDQSRGQPREQYAEDHNGSFASVESSQQSEGRSFASSSNQSEYSDNPPIHRSDRSSGVQSNFSAGVQSNFDDSDYTEQSYDDDQEGECDEQYEEEYGEESGSDSQQYSEDQDEDYDSAEESSDQYTDDEEEGLLPPVT